MAEIRITEVQLDMKKKKKWDDDGDDNTSNKKRMPNEESASYVVVVHGPPKVCKSLLIKCLVKHYTHNTPTDISNPITIIAGIKPQYLFSPDGQRRIQFVECPNNVNGMIDAAKYADAVIFLIDSSYEYLADEIRELASFISHMELHPISGRDVQPYMLVDRFEDVTPPEKDIDCTRDVIFYGYLRGNDIEKGTKLHIAGVGDFNLAGVTRVADPCPLPPVDDQYLEVDLDETTYPEIGRFKLGTYLMFEVRGVPSDMVDICHPCQPILVGGITPKGGDPGYVQAELKQHSWHAKSLKTNDPVIVSVGWRRYQTRPIYALKNCTGQYQMLEHTPEDVPCLAAFWGPLSPPSTRVVAVQSLADPEAAFRILATGVVLSNLAAKIVKKSKRIGTPCKIINELALIKDMFTSDDEIDQFKDAKVETNSGIRGKVNEAAPKKLLKTVKWKEGQSRKGIVKCTFELRIMKCDVVCMHVWTPAEVPHICNQSTTALEPSDRIWQILDTADKTLIKQNEIKKSKAHVVVNAEEGKIAREEGVRESLIELFEEDFEIGLVQKQETSEQRRAVIFVARVFPGKSFEVKKQKPFNKSFRLLTTVTKEELIKSNQSKPNEIHSIS
ncbi:hypothetical protein MKW94_020183 [Papaver nudicaule]|uniref:Uncharacterized protein n=1 Tax=Papaver nudicaule TaxID=74823 RepID=A0AA41VLV4_PAPNU|nr:hypothetical protein [Papaver nudicaule]